jgi:alkanesulfonate monooxygenase SsuD/methylene tetrahydromethanopterin reductase-like flavin-dependent oxidoreductase (luciferase family)
MKVGLVSSSFNSGDWERVQGEDWSRPASPSDGDVMTETIRLCELAEPLGYDSIWVGEHFGTPYSMWPDAMQSMAFWAGRTERVSLGSCVSVLPWHHPVTLASQAAMLDIMLQGREFTFGVGRGVARTEYEALGIDRGESRSRFDEVLEVLRLGLSQERFSFEGQHFSIPPSSIRPRPLRDDVLERLACAASTPSSMEIAARQGLGQLFVTGLPMDEISSQVLEYNRLRAEGGHAPAQPQILLWLYCTEDEDDVAYGEQLFGQYGGEAGLHYGFGEPNAFEGVKGYETYAERARAAQTASSQGAAGIQTETQPIGTPDTILARMRRLQQETGCKEIMMVPQYSGMPYEKAERSVRLFAETVLPHLQADDTPLPAKVVPAEAAGARS